MKKPRKKVKKRYRQRKPKMFTSDDSFEEINKMRKAIGLVELRKIQRKCVSCSKQFEALKHGANFMCGDCSLIYLGNSFE